MLFCNLFMERPAYLTTIYTVEETHNVCRVTSEIPFYLLNMISTLFCYKTFTNCSILFGYDLFISFKFTTFDKI